MDLAKIRKKSLQTPEVPGDDCFTTPTYSPELVMNTQEVVTSAPATINVDCFQSTIPVESITDAPLLSNAIFRQSITATCTPLEAILAGRTAAGCDDESILADDVTSEIVAESSIEFLCFRVSDEIYGINIMDIKEIIKPREVTEVPRAPIFVSGVLSLRGTIIPIIDMRVRLGLAREEPTGKERVIVIKNSDSFSGLLVDEVIQVVKIQLDAFESAPTVLDGIDRDFISGIGRSDGRLIIILNLEHIADINLY